MSKASDWGRIALDAQKAGDLAKAVDAYWQALQIDPANPHLYNNFAVVLKELGEYALAETCLKEALRLKPDFSAAFNNLGNVLRQIERAAEAVACFERALELSPHDPEILLNLGNARLQTLQIDASLLAYEHALRLKPDDADTRWNYALALLMAGRYREAWPYYEARWDLAEASYPFDRSRRWRGEPIDGTLVVWHEQGFGDSLQYLRAVPAIAARTPRARIVFAGPASLRRIVENSFPDVCWQSMEDAAAGEYRAQLPLMSAGQVLDWNIDTLPRQFPYLTANAESMSVARTWLGPERAPRRVGVVWGSGVWGRGRQDSDRQRKSMPFAQLEPLFKDNEIEWISLQVGPAHDELASEDAVRDAYGLISDWADTAGLISQLDLVISVDTGVAHLAGALGKPVWLMLKHDSGNFWLSGRSDSPWYPSMTIFRQQAPGDWRTVVATVADALQTPIHTYMSLRETNAKNN